MTQHVLILGAGASVDCGGPLMGNFLNIAEDLARDDNSGVDRAAFKRVFDGIYDLRRAHSNARLDLGNIENVLAAFEMAELFGRLGDLDVDTVKALPDAMRTLIAETIERRIMFTPQGQRLRPPASYALLAKICGRMVQDRKPPTIITFNYDVALDWALHFYRVPFSYCLDDAEPNGVRLLKLHGSLGWTMRRRDDEPSPPRDAGEVVPVQWHDVERALMLHNEAEELPLKLGRMLHAMPNTTGKPAIVTPSWSKLPAYRSLASVWRRAALELRDAEFIRVCGFSLAASDGFFNMLYAIGTTGPARLRQFHVSDPAKGDAVHTRFRDLLGQAAQPVFDPQKYRFREFVQAFQEAVGYGHMIFSSE